MTHVIARIVIWTLVIGSAYLILRPDAGDGARNEGSFGQASPIYLPPPKPARLITLDRALAERSLSADEAREYQSLLGQYQSQFWQSSGTTVEQALAGTNKGRRALLVEELTRRGLDRTETMAFIAVVQRDHGQLLEDSE